MHRLPGASNVASTSGSGIAANRPLAEFFGDFRLAQSTEETPLDDLRQARLRPWRVVAGRRVHRQPTQAVQRFRLIPVRVHIAVRHVLTPIKRRRVTRDVEHTRNGARSRTGLQIRIQRIDRSYAVDREVVVIGLRINRSDSDRPHTVCALVEIFSAVEKLAGQNHVARLRRLKPERDPMVGKHLRRDHACPLLPLPLTR